MVKVLMVILPFQTSFDGILNLSAFSCRQVTMQYGVVNKFGAPESSLTPVTSQTVDVTGGV